MLHPSLLLSILHILKGWIVCWSSYWSVSIPLNACLDFVNVTICISVLSIGLSCVFASSRTITALAETGFAPKIFTYVDKSSRPLWSVIATMAFAPLAFINLANEGAVICVYFSDKSLRDDDWKHLRSQLAYCLVRVILSVYVVVNLFMPVSYNLKQCTGPISDFYRILSIRFRRAWQVQGHSIDELPFRAFGGIWGSWFGVILITLVLIAQFYIVSVCAVHCGRLHAVSSSLCLGYLARWRNAWYVSRGCQFLLPCVWVSLFCNHLLMG